MKKKIFSVFILIFAILFVAFSSFATEPTDNASGGMIESSYNEVSVPSKYKGNTFFAEKEYSFKDMNFDGNVMGLFQDIDMDNLTIDGDTLILAQNIRINNLQITNGIVLIAGQNISIQSIESNGNVYIAGEYVEVEGKVKGLYVLSQNLTLNNGMIARDVYTYCDKLVINNGKFENIVATVSDMQIVSDTQITGSLKYNSEKEGNISETANIANIDYGKIVYEQKIPTDEDTLMEKVKNVIFAGVKAIIICGFVFLCAKSFIEKTKSEDVYKYIGFSALKGLGWAVLIPIVSIVLLFLGTEVVSIVGVAFVIMIIYFIVFWASVSLVSIAIMNEIAKKMKEDNKLKRFAIAVLVAVVIAILKQIPGLGVIVGVLVGVAGLGIFMSLILPNKNSSTDVSVKE